jgi:hypothetical protein
MVSGKLKIPVDHDGNDMGDDDTGLPDQDNIEAATDEICHSISSLFRLTVRIQNLSSRDRLERMNTIDVSGFESHDINHIKEKYPLAEKSSHLSERLGKANTKRWQILKYNEKHHEMIVGAVEGTGAMASGDGDVLGFHESHYMSEAAFTNMQTTVSTVYEDNISSSYRLDIMMTIINPKRVIRKHHMPRHRDQPSGPIHFVFHLHRPGMMGNLSNAHIVSGS